MKKLLLLLTLVSCADDVSGTDSSISESICGNNITEKNEECDGEIECEDNCIYNRYIFVSTYEQTGLFLDDLWCAHNADLRGFDRELRWIVWRSTSEENIKDIIFQSPNKYLRLDGEIIANNFQDLINGNIQNPININQYGENVQNELVWTGTNEFGNYTGSSCLNWNTDSEAVAGTYGNTSFISKQWTNYGTEICSNKYRFYCIESYKIP